MSLVEIPNGRRNWPTEWPQPIPDGDLALLREVKKARDLETMSALVAEDMLARAQIHADEAHPFDSEKPFVIYPPMNREPEAWLAMLLARAAQISFGFPSEESLTIIGMPRSARWIPQALMEKGMFPQAMYLFATKDATEVEILGKPRIAFDVLSYAHNRLQDGRRGMETVYLVEPELITGTKVILFEDVIAQGWTIGGIGEVIARYNPAGLYVVSPFSKGLIQGGTDFVQSCGFVTGAIELVCASEVKQPGMAQDNLKFVHPSYHLWQRT
jgi:hypothetical protein